MSHGPVFRVVAIAKLYTALLFGQGIPRTWGPQVSGLAASVALDRHDYQLGATIPLHIATETFSKDPAVFWGIRRLPERGFTISIRDSGGHVSERPLDLHRRFFSGDVTPENYRFGEPWALEASLIGKLELPDRLATYTLWITWRPLMGLDEDLMKPADFVVVSNVVELSIVNPPVR